ncbi:MFS transporter [Kitasatospora sp. Root107]|uniref:MFS transporter n=1 Tax=Kitasatospora sp. Root107 TaxID=1736424 RepID=UPI0007C7C7F2|nr:MFS transporter [Kitasatospora sp. Root107]
MRTLRRFGLPRVAGNGGLVGASVIDSLGTGLVLAFVLVYFARTTELALPVIGGALTLARLLAVPTAVTVGPLIDRWGPRRLALAGNLISAVGYTGFLFSQQVWQIVAAAWLAQVGAVTYWTSSTGLVVLAADGAERPRWFAMIHMLRNVGLGLGGALGAFLVGIGGTAGLRGVVAANAVSYLVAVLLLWRWRPAARAVPGKAPAGGGYRTVLRDRRYLLLVAINVCSVFSALIQSLLVAVYITEGLHREAWIAGALLVLNGAQVALTQTLVSKWLERFRPTRVIAVACGINALAFGIFAVLTRTPGWAVPAGLFLAMLLYTLAETAATPFAEELSVSLAPEQLRGRYLAVYQLSWTLGQTVAPGLLTLLLAGGATRPWLFLIGLSLAAVPALLLLERLTTTRPAPAELVAAA